MCSTFPELLWPVLVWSLHLTLSVLDKVWIISDTKTGSYCHILWRGSPYLGNISLSRALATLHMPV